MAAAWRGAWRSLVHGKWAHGLANSIGTPSARKQQQALDLQRLWLAAQVWRLTAAQQGSQPPLSTYKHLLAQSQAVGVEETAPLVAAHLRQQIMGAAAGVHACLAEAGDSMAAASAMVDAQARMSGQATGHGALPSGKAVLSQQQLSSLLQQRLGYALSVGPSTIDHPEAGLGLFVQGEAPAGAVVAVVPGVAYPRTQLSCMPNFPRVDQGNPFLSSTIDMTVVDSKPWGLGWGGHQHGTQAGATAHSSSEGSSTSSTSTSASASASASSSPGGHGARASGAPGPGASATRPLRYPSAGPQPLQPHISPADGSWALAALEGRHPLAWGHMANHPGPGMRANVLEAAFELHLGPGSATGSTSNSSTATAASSSSAPEAHLRAYIPVAPYVEPLPLLAHCRHYGGGAADQLADEGWQGAAAQALLAACGWPCAEEEVEFGPRRAAASGMPVRGLALVATQALRDGDEILLNYRLSPHVPRPAWYYSIDPEAEARRWAQLPLARLLA